MKPLITIIVIISIIALTISSLFAHRWCWSCNQDNTVGWHLMTPDERKDHQIRLANFSRYSSCREYVDRHTKDMEQRAEKKGSVLPVMQENPCDSMRAKGLFQSLSTSHK